MANTFKKIERLCSKTEIKELFSNRKSIYSFPIKIIWRKTSYKKKIPVKTLISVSKRRFKLAVDRNLLKRLIRESFRQNKHNFYNAVNKANIQLSIVIIYQANKKLPYSEIDKALKAALLKLQHQINLDY